MTHCSLYTICTMTKGDSVNHMYLGRTSLEHCALFNTTHTYKTKRLHN